MSAFAFFVTASGIAISEIFCMGIVGFLIFVCCCVYGSVGNEHMVSTFFFYIPLYFIAVSGKIYLGMAGKTAAYTDWRNPFCTRLCYMVCVSGIFVWTGIFG